MRRDKRLILKILRWVRDNARGGESLSAPDCRGYDSATVLYHVKLCHQAGFFEAEITEMIDGALVAIQDVTWAGHDHLEANSDC